MTFDMFALPAVLLVTATAITQILGRNWRINIAALGVQYIGVFILVAMHWPVEMAVTKMVAGWMAGAVLGIAASEAAVSGQDEYPELESVHPSGRIFRFLAASLVLLVVVSLAPRLVNWIPGLSLTQSWGALALIGLGLLYLGLTTHPLRVAAGLMTVLSGFEIIYAPVENSALVAGLLAAATTALAMIGAYLLLAPGIEENQ